MSFIVCPIVPFPNIYWWSQAISASQILLDEQEHFEKMSFRNRYMIGASNGVLQLSIALNEGRQQRKAMGQVQISNLQDWQSQHWRTLQSAYNRSPFFEFFAPSLQPLFENRYENLIDFSKEGILLLANLLDLKCDFIYSDQYLKNYSEAIADIRQDFRTNQFDKLSFPFKKYHQTFEDRNGFIPNLSILDLLFSEGKNAQQFLK